MTTPVAIDPTELATVTVTFNPDLTQLEGQLCGLPTACRKIVIDNASRPEIALCIDALSASVPNLIVKRNGTNLGLAAALNQGVSVAAGFNPKVTHVLLLDQDSEPIPGSVERLLAAAAALEGAYGNAGCVGPSLLDPDTGLVHGFHQATRWRWRRVYPANGSSVPVSCTNLNGSGTLFPITLFQALGGLSEELFIDHVDTDWAFRVLASGHGLWGIPDAVFVHRMGHKSVRFWWFGWHVWPSRSPQRHYYLFRNAVILMRKKYVPNVWKVWAVVKLALTLLVYFTVDHDRFNQFASMIQGVRDGLRVAPRRVRDSKD